MSSLQKESPWVFTSEHVAQDLGCNRSTNASPYISMFFSSITLWTMEHEYITTCLKSFDIGYRTCPNTGFFVLLGAQTNGQPHQQPKRNPRPQGLTYHVASLQKKAYLPPKILQFSIGKVRFQDFTPSKPSIFQGCMMLYGFPPGFSGTKATFHVILQHLGAQAQRNHGGGWGAPGEQHADAEWRDGKQGHLLDW